ncbi:MAG: transposase [Muribaculaceae bacterium]|nr:transposase [Muribaculaceae bacterium]
MPRKLRVPSPSGIYHVMLRGINRDDIFLDDIDFMKMEKILRSLAKPVDENGNSKPPLCKIFAYCLMTNHIHLLIAELDEPISDTVKRLGVAYVSYFNKRRKRSGPLFEGRFRSEPVDDTNYFITLLHYIHYNPVKAGMVKKPGWYQWSSWHEYELPEKTYERGICEQTIPFENLTRTQVKDIVLEAKVPMSFISPVDIERVDDTEAEIIMRLLVPEEFRDIENMKDLPKVVKLTISTKAKEYGVTYSQIINHLGVTKHFIQKGKLKTIK